MKLHYYEGADSFYIDLSAAVSTESREIADGLVVDYDWPCHVVGLDIQHASKRNGSHED